MATVTIKRGAIERVVDKSTLERWKGQGWAEIEIKAKETAQDKTLDKMNVAELDAKAASLGVTFPEGISTKAQKAAFIAEYLASKED